MTTTTENAADIAAPPQQAQETLTIPVAGELARATSSMLRDSRQAIYPTIIMGGLYVVATAMHNAGTAPILAVGGASALGLGALAVGQVRTWLGRARWRARWAGGCLAAAAAWTSAAAAVGTGMDASPLPSVLIVGGGLLAAPWWWLNRPRPRGRRAPAKPNLELPAPPPLPAIEAGPHEHQLAWREHVGARHHALEGSELVAPEQIRDHQGQPNGTAWIIDGGPGRHTYGAMRQALEEIKATLDRPNVDSLIYLDQDPEQRKTRAKLVVLERNPLIEAVRWARPTLDRATGLIPISVYPDGSGWAHYVLYKWGWGVPHDLIVGVPGSGKSAVLRLIMGESLNAGNSVMWFNPHLSRSGDDTASRVTGAFRTPAEIYAGMRALEAAIEERLEILSEVGEHRMGPEYGHPILHVVVDEASHESILGNRIIGEILTAASQQGRKLWIKLSVATQDPSSDEGFHDFATLREMLIGGNVIALRVASSSTARSIRKGNLEVHPEEIPEFFDRAQALPTTGFGYVLTGNGSELPSRARFMSSEAFSAGVPIGALLDERTAAAWERGYLAALRELEQLAGGPVASVTPLHPVGDDGAHRTALVALCDERGRITLGDITTARICSPSQAFHLLTALEDDGTLARDGDGYVRAS
ncbi:hypothetical protein Aph01nite_08400 [Acrocarpospora phusangensis]|uniref:FtsK domain-containing protein n=1 Tax=Acrocarpospora phusangensis TaxID=1070424 RepID=A0A919Q8B0_9ACTN|nr:hypothetical protein [Acrocarpospora phusangensis]GIH22530.1 hypothetical protein Aph01nite_08400 [Acrocarpospora phusangensis]